MAKVEDLSGIHGTFKGTVRPHPDPNLNRRVLADGSITYQREVDGEKRDVTTFVNGVSVRRLHGSGVFDNRRYIRIFRGPKENRDKIIGLIDQH